MSNRKLRELGQYYNLRDKAKSIRDNVNYLLCETQSLFKWNGLPDTIPARNMELLVQGAGYGIMVKYKDELYVLDGGLGGVPDFNLRPTEGVVANAYLNMSNNYPILWNKAKEDEADGKCVVLENDSLRIGLLPLFEKYSTQIAEVDLSIYLCGILSRTPYLLSAETDKEKKACDEFIEGIEAGKLSSIQSNPFTEGIKEHILGSNQHQQIGALLQLRQGLIASLYNKIGLNVLMNQFKAESVSPSEESANQDILDVFVDDMLRCRQRFCEIANSYFGTNISVGLSSSWEKNRKEEELELQIMESETEELSENEQQETITDETSDSDKEDAIEEQESEKEPKNIEEETLIESIENIEETVEEIKEEINDVLDKEGKEEEDE